MKKIPKVKRRIADLLDQHIRKAKEDLQAPSYVTGMQDSKRILMSANLTNGRIPKFDRVIARAIGQDVKRKRLSVRFTQQYVANELGLSQANYSRCENGKRQFTEHELQVFEEIIETFQKSRK